MDIPGTSRQSRCNDTTSPSQSEEDQTEQPEILESSDISGPSNTEHAERASVHSLNLIQSSSGASGDQHFGVLSEIADQRPVKHSAELSISTKEATLPRKLRKINPRKQRTKVITTSVQSNDAPISYLQQETERRKMDLISTSNQAREISINVSRERYSIRESTLAIPVSANEAVALHKPQVENAVSANFKQTTLKNAPVIFGGQVSIHYHQQPRNADQSTSSDTDKDHICSKFSECLKASAREVSGTINLPIDLEKHIHWVKLQIITDIPQPPDENLDNLWHFHYRKDRRAVLIPSDRTVELKDIFKIGMEKAKATAKYKCHNEEAKQKYIIKHGNIVIALGQAGIGKTTLCKLFIQLILDGTLREENFEYIFYIPFRAINYKREMSFFKFLVKSCSCQWEHTNKSDDILLKELQSNSKVILILDGLDEAIMSTNDLSCVHADDESTAENFFKNILTGNLFPAAKKFITSRPRQFYALPTTYRPQFIVSVIGLNKPAQDELCKQICDPDSKEVIDYLNSHLSLSSHCYVPVNCILTTSCLYNMMKKHGEQHLVTITSVMFYGITQFARSEHFKGNKDNNLKQLQQLAGLAWYGIDCQKIIFDEGDFQQLGIEENTRQAFLQTYADSNLKIKIYDGDKKSYFVHLIWQEFFAAIHLMQFMSVNCFEQNASKFSDARFEMVLKFLYGFCNPDLKSGLWKLFPGISGFEIKKNILKDLTISLSTKSPKSGEVTTLACSWLHESQESEITTDYINKFPNKLEIQGDIFPSDVECVHYVLRACCKPHVLEVVRAKFIGDCVNRFLTMMVKTLELSSYIKLTTLDVRDNEVNEDGAQAISCCLSNLEKLILKECNLTAATINIVSDGIKSLSHKIKVLNVSKNRFGDVGERAILSCLNNIIKLYMEDCGIKKDGVRALIEAINNSSQLLEVFKFSYLPSTPNQPRANAYDSDSDSDSDEYEIELPCGLNILKNNDFCDSGIDSVGIEALSAVITKLPQSMEYLDISENEMTIDGCVHLASCLNNIEQLEMRECNMDADMIEVLSNAIGNLRKPMKYLNIGNNNITIDGSVHLASCLNNIEQLNMHNCEMKVEMIEVLCNAIKHLQKPMKQLDLSGNDMDAQSMAALVSCLANVDQLLLMWITDEEMKCFAHSINDLQLSLKHLDISQNNMTIDGCVRLASCLNNIEQLKMCECNMRADMIEVLCNAIKDLRTPMEYVDISCNRMTIDGFIHLASCLNNIELLNMMKCEMEAEMIEVLCNAIKNLQNPMKYLDISDTKMTIDGCIHLASCLNNIEQLCVSNCEMETKMIEVLCSAIKDLQKPMQQLDLSENKLDKRGAIALSRCLFNVDRLRVEVEDEETMEEILNAIKQLPRPIKYFEFSGGLSTYGFNEHEVDALCAALHNIEKLDIVDCGLSSDGKSRISAALSRLPDPIPVVRMNRSTPTICEYRYIEEDF